MYYITAVIVPVIKTAYCEIYYKAHQPLVSSFWANPGLSDESVKWNAPTKISCKCDDKQQPLLMMSMHFILWRKSKRNVKWLNHCLAIWTLLFKLEQECCCQVILDVKQEYVQSDDSSAVGSGVATVSLSKGQINNICGVWFIQSKFHCKPGWILKMIHCLWLLKATTLLLMSASHSKQLKITIILHAFSEIISF